MSIGLCVYCGLVNNIFFERAKERSDRWPYCNNGRIQGMSEKCRLETSSQERNFMKYFHEKIDKNVIYMIK